MIPNRLGSSKKFNLIVTELFIRGRNELNISLWFYFSVPKNVRPNYMHYFNVKTPNKRKHHQFKFNIEFKNFMKFYKKIHSKTISFCVK